MSNRPCDMGVGISLSSVTLLSFNFISIIKHYNSVYFLLLSLLMGFFFFIWSKHTLYLLLGIIIGLKTLLTDRSSHSTHHLRVETCQQCSPRSVWQQRRDSSCCLLCWMGNSKIIWGRKSYRNRLKTGVYYGELWGKIWLSEVKVTGGFSSLNQISDEPNTKHT